jgi:NADH-quinone oxidoreductase subunit J
MVREDSEVSAGSRTTRVSKSSKGAHDEGMAMVAAEIAFGLFSVVLIGSSLGAVLLRDVWHAALLLGVALLTVAGVYVTAQADFLAAVQILVYVGGVLILITFAVMLTRRESDEPEVADT